MDPTPPQERHGTAPGGGFALRRERPLHRKKRFWLLVAILLPPLWIGAHVVRAVLRSPDLPDLVRENPTETSLMRARAREARAKGKPQPRSHVWVAYERISPHLRKAVLLAEDASFYQHEGLDFYEIKESIRKDWETKRFTRGGSTITQQLAKNLWLGGEKTIGRKIEEIVLAIRLERTISKKRILELYLNLIEWGDGVYGAEAAARRWFGKSASGLSVKESAILAGMIPNPRKWNPDRTGEMTWRTKTVLRRLRASGYITREMYDELVGRKAEPEAHADSIAPLPFGTDSASVPETAEIPSLVDTTASPSPVPLPEPVPPPEPEPDTTNGTFRDD